MKMQILIFRNLLLKYVVVQCLQLENSTTLLNNSNIWQPVFILNSMTKPCQIFNTVKLQSFLKTRKEQKPNFLLLHKMNVLL